MFIIEISRASLKLFFVSGKDAVQSLAEIPWAEGKLKDIFCDIAKTYKRQYKIESIRVLVDDDLSYVLALSIPKNELQTGVNERQLVAKLISEQIPEILENDDWDFKEESETPEVKTVRVFAPVKSILRQLSAAAAAAKIKIEAIEPISLARERNPNPILAIAEKTDLRGRDEQVLNIVPSAALNVAPAVKTEKKEEFKIKKNIKDMIQSNLIIFIMAAAAIIMVIVLITLYLIKK